MATRRTFLKGAGLALITAVAGCSGDGTAKADASYSQGNTQITLDESDFFESIARKRVSKGDKFYVSIRDNHDVDPEESVVRADSISASMGSDNSDYFKNDGLHTVQVAPQANGYWFHAYDEGRWTISAKGERVTEDEEGVFTEVVVNSIVVDTNPLEFVESSVERYEER